MSDAIAVPPEMNVPRFRYWGDRQPPKNRADMFSVRVAKAEAGDDTSAPDTGSSSAGSVATLRIYGPIDSWGGWWGISAKDVAQALDGLPADVTDVRVRINSPGGEVWEGMAILNMLRAHRARIVAVVDGLAASAASVIAAGCDETVMSPGTQMMIHDASAFAYGPAAVMTKAARFLDSTSDSIASIYSEAAGGTDEEWRALMVAETWFTAKEAVEAKLADKVAVVSDSGETSTAGDDEPDIDDLPAEEPDDTVEDAFDLSIFNYAGRTKAPAPKPPTASADGTTQPEGAAVVDLNDTQIAALREQVGFPADADADTIVAAVTEALNERAEDNPSNSDPKVPTGHVVIPAAKLADLEAAATLATTTAQNLHNKERDSFLDSVRNKYLPTSRAGWETEYDRDPEGVKAHFAKAPVLIPTSELGHSDDAPENALAIDDSELQAFASGFGLSKEDLRG